MVLHRTSPVVQKSILIFNNRFSNVILILILFLAIIMILIFILSGPSDKIREDFTRLLSFGQINLCSHPLLCYFGFFRWVQYMILQQNKKTVIFSASFCSIYFFVPFSEANGGKKSCNHKLEYVSLTNKYRRHTNTDIKHPRNTGLKFLSFLLKET